MITIGIDRWNIVAKNDPRSTNSISHQFEIICPKAGLQNIEYGESLELPGNLKGKTALRGDFCGKAVLTRNLINDKLKNLNYEYFKKSWSMNPVNSLY